MMELSARDYGIETHRTAFGWNKSFIISIKGHPLSEQFRIILPGENEEKKSIPEALRAEERLKSSWFILGMDGKLVPVKDFNFTNHKSLEKFAEYELAKTKAAQGVPPHVMLMKRLEIADYESGSDPGNFRWYPKGRSPQKA